MWQRPLMDECGLTDRASPARDFFRLAVLAGVVRVATKARHIPAVIGDGWKPQKVR